MLAVLMTLFFVYASAQIGVRRLFWFDEILTMHVARLPNLVTVWKALADYLDGHPITYHLLAWVAYRLSGHWDVSVRLISAAAMGGAMLAVFDCTRRLTSGVYGLIALSVLASSCLAFYAYEARPYALLVMLAAISLWCWIHTDPGDVTAARVFGAVLFLAVTSHFYAVFLLTPYAVWEIYRGGLRRLPVLKVVAGIAGVFCGCALCSAQIITSMRISKQGTWALPSLRALAGSFAELFPGTWLWLVVILALAVVFSLIRERAAPMKDGERVSWFFLLIPLAGYLVAKLLTDFFNYRYFIALLPGAAVGFAVFLYRHLGAHHGIARGVCLLLAGLAVGNEMLTLLHPDRIYYFGDQQGGTKAALQLESLILADGKRYITSPARLLIAEVRYYSQRPEHYAELRPPKWQFTISKYDPSVLYWNMEDLRRHAAETAVIQPTPEFVAEIASIGIRAISNPKHSDLVYLATDKAAQ